jgi:hypothetical protein
MGRQIIKQPNGLFAVWSSNVDDFIVLDQTEDELVKLYVDRAAADIERDVREEIATLKQGGKPHAQFTKTWDEAVRWRRIQHGKKPPKIKDTGK